MAHQLGTEQSQPIVEGTPQGVPSDDMDYYYSLGTIFLLTIGITLAGFSIAYARDLNTLRTVPDAIWSAICGKPADDGITLPLVVTLSVLSLLGSGVLHVWKQLRHRL